jgi:hypothetical protein
MRTNCRHYDSRTYAGGEVVRKCRLDLAPEAPWRCPDDCPRFELRRMDVGWNYGSLGAGAAIRPAPEAIGADVAALLNEAEDIVNSAAPDIISELAEKPKKGLLRKAKKNKKKKKK